MGYNNGAANLLVSPSFVTATYGIVLRMLIRTGSWENAVRNVRRPWGFLGGVVRRQSTGLQFDIRRIMMSTIFSSVGLLNPVEANFSGGLGYLQVFWRCRSFQGPSASTSFVSSDFDFWECLHQFLVIQLMFSIVLIGIAIEVDLTL